MKKLLGLIIIMVFSASVFGQNIGNFSDIQRTSTHNNTVEDHISHNDGYAWIPNINFKLDKFVYMLAYDTISRRGHFDNITRNIYLYCKDTTNVNNPWTKASDVVFIGKYYNANNYEDVDFFRFDAKQHNTSHSKIVFNKSNILVTFDVWIMNDNNFNIVTKTIILKLNRVTTNGNNFYIKK